MITHHVYLRLYQQAKSLPSFMISVGGEYVLTNADQDTWIILRKGARKNATSSRKFQVAVPPKFHAEAAARVAHVVRRFGTADMKFGLDAETNKTDHNNIVVYPHVGRGIDMYPDAFVDVLEAALADLPAAPRGRTGIGMPVGHEVIRHAEPWEVHPSKVHYRFDHAPAAHEITPAIRRKMDSLGIRPSSYMSREELEMASLVDRNLKPHNPFGMDEKGLDRHIPNLQRGREILQEANIGELLSMPQTQTWWIMYDNNRKAPAR